MAALNAVIYTFGVIALTAFLAGLALVAWGYVEIHRQDTRRAQEAAREAVGRARRDRERRELHEQFNEITKGWDT